QPVPTVGFLASVEPVKQCGVALDAIREAQRSLPNLRVVSFGQKPLPTEWDLPANFTFHLQPAQHDIPALYQSCDVWLTSSASEGFGMPGLEAAAGHCPLISTRCGGPEDYVFEGRNGHLVDVGDAPGMADAIRSVVGLDEPAWRAMSAASYDIARDFDWDRSAARLESALLGWLGRESEHAA
ncbi:MAG: glycosyltransferase, partial [Planctomycetota bacterium]